MMVFVGIGLTLAMVFGGYILAGGKISIVLEALPYEMMIIGGAGVGAFLVSNDRHLIKHTLSDLGRVFKGPRYGRQDYLDLLCFLYELLGLARSRPAQLEEAIEAPANNPLFQRYPKISKDPVAIALVCDCMRASIMNYDDPFQVGEVLNRDIEQIEHRMHETAHALTNVADALPALGIVAAVLGVVKTMSSIDKPPEILGGMIGGALVGTFLGVFLAYTLVGPFAARVKAINEADTKYYSLIRDALVAHAHKHTAALCIEAARKSIGHDMRPSFEEVETAVRALGPNLAVAA
jgi:chemotaxis protein MotA